MRSLREITTVSKEGRWSRERRRNPPPPPNGRRGGRGGGFFSFIDIPSQTGEMGDLGTSLFFFLSSSLDLPRRASWSRANLRFARRCWGVCACECVEDIPG